MDWDDRRNFKDLREELFFLQGENVTFAHPAQIFLLQEWNKCEMALPRHLCDLSLYCIKEYCWNCNWSVVTISYLNELTYIESQMESISTPNTELYLF
jgi:hypothetical protein